MDSEDIQLTIILHSFLQQIEKWIQIKPQERMKKRNEQR